MANKEQSRHWSGHLEYRERMARGQSGLERTPRQTDQTQAERSLRFVISIKYTDKYDVIFTHVSSNPGRTNICTAVSKHSQLEKS